MSRGLLIAGCAATATAAVLGAGLMPASGAAAGPMPASGAAAGSAHSAPRAGAAAADTTPPSEPVGLTPRTVYRPGVAGLTWTQSTDNVGITGYDIYAWSYSSPVTGSFSRVQANFTHTATQVTADVIYLMPGRAHLFYVVAVDAAGNRSVPSLLAMNRATAEPPNMTPSPGPSSPPMPWDLRVFNGPAPGYAGMQWATSGSTSTTHWPVFRRSSSQWGLGDDSPLPRTMVRIGGEASYTFQVVARDDAGNLSNPSNAATYLNPSPSPSPAPSATRRARP
ncbi:hypothetical protein [Sphaerisporangium dianthi]|uniref:Fibronectin type-III domain-containing protein n=1 Tax=Sphaerisporangium dianthi TaxID=1436120 RepID=A0ABV9CKA0_9ACTN